MLIQLKYQVESFLGPSIKVFVEGLDVVIGPFANTSSCDPWINICIEFLPALTNWPSAGDCLAGMPPFWGAFLDGVLCFHLDSLLASKIPCLGTPSVGQQPYPPAVWLNSRSHLNYYSLTLKKIFSLQITRCRTFHEALMKRYVFFIYLIWCETPCICL